MHTLRTHDIMIFGGINGKVGFRKFPLKMNPAQNEKMMKRLFQTIANRD